MFIKDDIYTTSSSFKLLNCWTDKVTKFDSSAFYNWEQDNMPVYDLEERTYYLWEKMGFPTSSIPGVALVVSADAPAESITCNKNIFRSVSAAIAALPEMINFPIIIEVANFGNLGDMVLDNFKFGPRGSLEIINRNFAHTHADGSGGLFNVGTTIVPITQAFVDTNSNNKYNYLSSIYTPTSVFYVPGLSYDMRYILSPKAHFAEASCMSISAPVYSGTTGLNKNVDNDTRWSSNKVNAFISMPKAGLFMPAGGSLPQTIANIFNSSNQRSTLVIGSNSNVDSSPATNDLLTFTPYDVSPDTNDSIYSVDVSTIDDFTNNHIYLTNSPTNKTYNGLFYNNRLNKLVINNCEGPIFVRNFFLDGSSYFNTNNNYGIEVNNSKNIYLENNVVCRYRKAGIIFNNSNVTLLRGCVATRNYDFDSSNNRITSNWNTKAKFDYFNTTSKISNIDEGAGLIANNSYITVSSTRKFEETKFNNELVESALERFNASLSPIILSSLYPFFNKNYIFEFSKNSNGMILNNSVLDGGEVPFDNSFGLANSYHLLNTINIDFYNNTECGIRSFNSKISFDGRLSFIENRIGMNLDSSILEADKLWSIFNQRDGIKAHNSTINYGKNTSPYAQYYTLDTYSPIYFSANGKHISLNNSEMSPVFTSGMDSVYDQLIFDNTISRGDDKTGQEPSIQLTKNSNAILISPKITRDSSHAANSQVCKGSELEVTTNSKANLVGTKSAATRIFGPSTRTKQKNIAACYAGDNSTIEINGPTVIAKFGIDLLGENNSNILINPYKDTSSIDLSNTLNHTSVELHATRSCVVVDNNSTFKAKDLGHFERTWDVTGNYYTNRFSSGIDYNPINQIYVSAGSLQFYPNPITTNGGEYDLATFPGVADPTIPSDRTFTLANNQRHLKFLKDSNTTNFDFSTVTNGGYCIRALNNSLIKIDNVNFPTGWWNCSAPYFDNTINPLAGGMCYKTFIWNVADTSQLKASYVSVSGLYPIAAGYIGPSGVWGSGTGAIASGLPSSTLDTGRTSVLDYFGAAPASANPFGTSSAQNYGVFRLYFSVNPAINAFTDVSSNTFEVLPQIYAQGYQPSGSIICSAHNLSSIYKMALQYNSSNNLVASGYYYGSGVVDMDGHIRVLLDESASNLFANAKHCSVGKSGNAKLTSIYYPYTSVIFGSSRNTKGIKSSNLFDLQRDN